MSERPERYVLPDARTPAPPADPTDQPGAVPTGRDPRQPGEPPEIEPTPLERAWAETRVEAESPAGRVKVTMVGDHDLQVWVDPTFYATASTSALEAEAGRAARQTYVNRTRAYYATWSELSGTEQRPVRTPVSPEQEEYLRRREEVTASGSAYDGRISLTMVGTSHFSVHVDAGVTREIDAPTFCAYGREAALACLREHELGWQRAHFDVYVRPRMEKAGLL